MREEIIEGRLTANERLKVSALAERYGTSTNPVREALQQLRGEGFVVIEPNRGARVRPVDEAFLRDTYEEMEVLIEPYLTRWFVGVATDADVVRLEAIQAEIEAHNFADVRHNSSLDTQFHLVFYDHHYNRHAVELWWKHREILSAISRRYPHSLKRRAEVVAEHRELIAHLKERTTPMAPPRSSPATSKAPVGISSSRCGWVAEANLTRGSVAPSAKQTAIGRSGAKRGNRPPAPGGCPPIRMRLKPRAGSAARMRHG